MTDTTALPPTGLLVEMLRDPEGAVIHTATPRFGWIVNDRAPNMAQTAFRILVASSLEVICRHQGDLWDSAGGNPGSGWTTDSRSLHIPYAGLPLAAGRAYWWKVRTWNSRNQPSPWSEPQCFRLGDIQEGHTTPRQPLVRVAQAPVAVVVRDDGVCFADFGKAAFGTLGLTLTADQAGEVRLRLGEVLAAPATIHSSPGGTRRFREMVLTVVPGTQEITVEISPDARNTDAQCDHRKAAAILMPAEVGEVFPFRYAEIQGPVRPPRRAEIRRLAVWYPFDEGASAFVSSSPVLNDVWEMCRYSMKATSFCGVHVDGDRERIPYEGDCYINQLGYYCCDREYALSRYSHEYLITHPTWPTEWVLFSVQTAWLDYLYTGDASSLAFWIKDLEAKSLAPLAREDGLISTVAPPVPPEVRAAVHFHPQWAMRDIVDWPQGERDGYDLRPVNTVVNAFHWRALVLLARLRRALGDEAAAAAWRQRAERVRAAMLRTLVDPQTGLFVDGEGSTHSSLHATIFPLAFGVTPPAMVPAALAQIRAKGMVCSVYSAQFFLEALYRGGDDAAAMACMTSTAERSWAHWIYEVGTTVAMEAWGDRFKPNQDWNHAWGAAPANIIPRFVLGVRPAAPGFGRILVEPRPASLTYAQGRVPTIRGPVEVVIEQEPGRRFGLTAVLPANTTATFSLPRMHERHDRVCLDGRTIQGLVRGDRIVVDGIGSGRHTMVREA